MLAYRFRLSFEDQDGFLREMEVRSDQTFVDFHEAIVSNLGLDPGMLSSFFICDHNFRKKKEISLIDMNPEQEPGSENEDGKPASPKVIEMKDAVLSDFIDDPHQKLMYVYDYMNYWTFYIELQKIVKADGSHTYPRVTKTTNEVPRELTATPQQIPGVDKSLEFGFDEDVYDPEDVKGLEGEEDFFDDQDNEPGGRFDEDQL
jgi:hypothetical protein